MFENVEYEWNLSDDNLTDVSDDDENFKVSSWNILYLFWYVWYFFSCTRKYWYGGFLFFLFLMSFIQLIFTLHIVYQQNGMSTPEKKTRVRPYSTPGSGSPGCPRSADQCGLGDHRGLGDYRGSEHRTSSSRWRAQPPLPPPVTSKPIC